jgi:hypothetical protein
MEDTQTMDESTPEGAANAMSQPGKFSLIERLRGRNMPTDKVNLYTDEGAAYERRLILEELDGEKQAGFRADKDAIAKLEASLADVEARIKDSVAVVHMKGISSERYDELLEIARESFPTEYEEWQNPLTGQKVRAEKENEQQNDLFNSLFISESIEKVVMGDAEDTDITPEWWIQFRGIAPLDGLRLVVEAAYKMRMTVQWMDEIQSEDFSPRS